MYLFDVRARDENELKMRKKLYVGTLSAHRSGELAQSTGKTVFLIIERFTREYCQSNFEIFRLLYYLRRVRTTNVHELVYCVKMSSYFELDGAVHLQNDRDC